jgi:hypothetical protein
MKQRFNHILKYLILLVAYIYATSAHALEKIPDTFTEPYSESEIRYKVKNVNIDGEGKIKKSSSGGTYEVEMEILHDCESCGDAINQVIVGLSSDERAQISVWHGKNRSGGPSMIVNPGTAVASFVEDNYGPAEWVKVYFTIDVPDKPGEYYLRTRYAQAYTGNLLRNPKAIDEQEIYQEPLDWWKVDRPNGPLSDSNIGVIIVE